VKEPAQGAESAPVQETPHETVLEAFDAIWKTVTHYR